jgi:enoyl-CoA hydratase/carnithine racemase
MNEKAVLFEKKGSIGIITLNLPERKNAVSVQMATEMREIRSRIGWDSGLAVILVTGRGPVFSVGTDPEAYQAFAHREAFIHNLSVAAPIGSLTQPVIGVINGDAFGQGLELALACDIRIASDQARYAMPQIQDGELPFDGGTQRLPRLIGKNRAMEMILEGPLIDAREARRIGLVNHIFPRNELLSSGLKTAEELAAKGPLALRYAKEAVVKGMDMTLEQGLRLEADLYFLLHSTEDRREGITAFREKRAPVFQGK